MEHSSTTSWLSVTPGSGQLKGTVSSVVTASVNAGGLVPSKNPYYADLSFVFGQSSLTVMAQLTVQAAPPMAPIMSASPLSLNFSNIQGQPDPTGQVVTITNNGRSPLSWHVTATPLPSFVWLNCLTIRRHYRSRAIGTGHRQGEYGTIDPWQLCGTNHAQRHGCERKSCSR